MEREGGRYGPAELPTLAGWISEGRIGPDTLLQPEGSSATIAAGTVAGLSFADSARNRSQFVDRGGQELRMAWGLAAVGLFGGLIPCFGRIALAAPIIGMILALRARREGARGATWALFVNLAVLIVTSVATLLLASAFSSGFPDLAPLRNLPFRR